MILITSSAYLLSEFQAEFGKIPPCMIPLGNRKLIEHQVTAMRNHFGDDIYVSLPASYELLNSDKKVLEALKVKPIYVPDDFNLSEAILFCLTMADDDGLAIKVAYGDTFFSAFPHIYPNTLGVSYTEDNYEWKIEKDGDESLVWCGFYAFSDKQTLLRSLSLYRGDFIEAVENYRHKVGMTTQEMLDWHDLGHINTYFACRAKMTTQRAFNSLKIDGNVLYKHGQPQQKILAEKEWFTNIPLPIKQHTPSLIGSGEDQMGVFYILEYLANLPLNELFVHGRLETKEWRRIFKLIHQYMHTALDIKTDEMLALQIKQDYEALTQKKTLSRVQNYAKSNHLNLKKTLVYGGVELPCLEVVLEQCIAKSLSLPICSGILHGDLCFSNILLDTRLKQIKVIDPRGITATEQVSIYGDIKYDLAKLTHSVIGLYDFIIAGYYTITEDQRIEFNIDRNIEEIQKSYIQLISLRGISIKEIMPLVCLLFFSMLPLHSDRPDRQKAMFINGLRLYKDYVLNE